MLGRDRRAERRDERRAFGAGGNAVHYRMREKLMSIGDDSWIEDDGGHHVFKVNGKALRIRKTLVLEDPSGTGLFEIQERPVRVRDVMEVERASGGTAATVKKAMLTPLRERFTVDVAGGPGWEVKGNITDHEYEISVDGTKIAEVSKRWFRVRDTYGVEILPGQDDALVLAVTVCIEHLA